MRLSGAGANWAAPRAVMRGVAALEFMLILMVLLPAFYVGVSYAITILARQMLTQAAAEGGRAMLRAGTLAQRQTYATSAISLVMTWPAPSAVTTTFTNDTTYPCPAAGAATTLAQCIMHITLTVNQPMTANWPGLSNVVPSSITGSTAVTLDTSTLSGT